MTDNQIEKMLWDILCEADYDTAKQMWEETAEEPEFAESFRFSLVRIVREHLME